MTDFKNVYFRLYFQIIYIYENNFMCEVNL